MSGLRSVISLIATSAPPIYLGKYAREKMRTFFTPLEARPLIRSASGFSIAVCSLELLTGFMHSCCFLGLFRHRQSEVGWRKHPPLPSSGVVRGGRRIATRAFLAQGAPRTLGRHP